MHHYNWNPGDYARRTLGLSPMQDLAYRRMLDRYYLDEAPFAGQAEDVAESVGMYDPDDPDAPNELRAVKAVLRRYFDWIDGAWHHQAADEAIADFNLHLEQSRKGGVTSGAVRKQQAAARRAEALARGEVGGCPTKIEAPLKHPQPITHNPNTTTPPTPAPAPAPPPPAPPAPPPPVKAAASPPPASGNAHGGPKSGDGDLFVDAPAPTPAKKSKKGASATAAAAAGGGIRWGYDFPSPEFIPPDLWAGFIELRRAKATAWPFTWRAAEEAVDNLLKCQIAGIDPVQRLKDTIAKAWRSPPAPNHYDEARFKALKQSRSAGTEDFYARMTGETDGTRSRTQRPNAADVSDVEPKPPRAE